MLRCCALVNGFGPLRVGIQKEGRVAGRNRESQHGQHPRDQCACDGAFRENPGYHPESGGLEPDTLIASRKALLRIGPDVPRGNFAEGTFVEREGVLVLPLKAFSLGLAAFRGAVVQVAPEEGLAPFMIGLGVDDVKVPGLAARCRSPVFTNEYQAASGTLL